MRVHDFSHFWQQCLLTALRGDPDPEAAEGAIRQADVALAAYKERFQADLDKHDKEEDERYGWPPDDDAGLQPGGTLARRMRRRRLGPGDMDA